MRPKTLTLGAAAKRLGESLQTIRTWIDVGLMPVVKTPAGQRKVPAEIVELLAESEAARPTYPHAKEDPHVQRSSPSHA